MIKPTPSQIKSWIHRNIKDYKVTSNGKEIRFNNPFSIDDDYHAWVNLYKGLVNDFRPSYKEEIRGTFLSFVMKYRKISFKEAVREVMGDNINISQDLAYDKDYNEKSGEVNLPPGFVLLEPTDDSISKLIKTYLNRRKISNLLAYELSVGYSGLSVVFPYYENDRIVYWQSRSITDKFFAFPSDSNKSHFVYNIDRIDPKKPVIITESIFNSLMFKNAGAVGGSDLSVIQRDKLRSFGVTDIILALDFDEAGIAGAVKSYDKLCSYFNLYYSFTNIKDCDWNDVAMNGGDPYDILKKNIVKLDYKSKVKLALNNKSRSMIL